ncbi:MAG TPA: PHB depolymerase family esterase, partial [Cellvibrionaceae bacterium]
DAGAFRIAYDANGYVELHLERLVEVHSITLHSGNVGSNRFAMQSFEFQAHNGGCYHSLPGGSYNLPNDTTRTVTLNLATPYITDRIRLVAKDNISQIREIKVNGLAATGARPHTANCGNPGNITAHLAAGYSYALYLPPGYNEAGNKNKQYPVVVSLHGLGGRTLNTQHTAPQANPEGFIRQMKKTAMVNNFPAIVIAPHYAPAGNSGSGWLNRDRVHKLTLAALREFRIDPDRVIVTGLSAGGSAVRQLIENGYRDTVYAAFIPVAFQAPNQVAQYCHYTKAPIWVMGGNSDGGHHPGPWITVKETRIPEHCDTTAENMRITAYEGLGHSAALWDGAYAESELHAFMLSIHRSDWISSSYSF